MFYRMINYLIQSIINKFKSMKVSVNKPGSSAAKAKHITEKSQCTTGVNSRQRSQIQSLVRLRDSKNIATITQKDEIGAVKARQIFTIIETFYSTLCDLPLEKLVNSAEPEVWITEQEQTLRTLQSKLRKLGKQKDQEYYRWKLKSVQTILGNIRQNLAMLNRMNQLKNYCSGTQSSNYRSNRGSSFDNSSKNIKLGQFASDSDSIKQMLNYDEYPIENSQVPKSATSKGPEMMAQTVNSEIESSDEETFTKSQVFSKQNKIRRVVPREGQNRNDFNKGQILQKGNKSNLTNDIKDKTLTKVHVLPSKSQTTLNNLSSEHRYATTANRVFHLSNEQTKRSQNIREDSSFKLQTIPNEYVELIKQLRLQLMQKDKQIQKLLINEQEFDETIEIFHQRQKEKTTQILFLKENALNHEKQREKMQNEIRRLNSEADDLRQTIKLQRDRYKKQEREKDKVEEKLHEQIQSREELLSEIDRLKQENKQSRKNERQMKQKLEIYTRKYFVLYGTLQTMKEEMRSLSEDLAKEKGRTRTQSHFEAVKKIIEHHKQKLCSSTFQQ